ncbi:MAG: tetratricopeptide repeat protein [Saprospiraceae bacterium]|nr:tetratricopeptide repeat protein [Saprospiraceae bacterium]
MIKYAFRDLLVLLGVVTFISVNTKAQNRATVSTDIIKIDSSEFYLNLANDQFELGQFQKSLRFLDKSILFNQKNFESLYTRASVKYFLNDVKGSLADYEKAINLNMNEPYPYIYRGTILSKAGRFQEAIKDFDKALEMEEDAMVLYNRAITRMKTREYEKALMDFEKLEEGEWKF